MEPSSPLLVPRPVSQAGHLWFQWSGEKCPEAPQGRGQVGPRGAGHSPRGRDSGSSSELDLKAETVEALAVRKLAGTGTVAERAATRTARGPTLKERRKK